MKKPKTQAEEYQRCLWALVFISVMLVVVLVLLLVTPAQAQVSVFTDPESDAIVFEPYPQTGWGTITVEDPLPGQVIEIEGAYMSHKFIVSPGGYVTPMYEVAE